MDSAEASSELLETVSISDVANTQYIMPRMTVDNSQLLNAEIPLHHSSLVVDLGAGEFIPVTYPSEDLLGQDLTEEDRRLAAALVAVQLSQQQKQQQIQQDSNIISTPLPSLVATPALDGKVTLNDQQLILNDKSANGNYLQIVGVDNLYENFGRSSGIKCEEENDFSTEPKDSDVENQSDNRSSKKSLPHKKRIPRKLKKPAPSSRKSFKCSTCQTAFPTSEAHANHQAFCRASAANAFRCQICMKAFQDQLQFFEHLKTHYEPPQSTTPEPPDVPEVEEKGTLKLEVETPKDTLLSSLLNLHCITCNKTFKRQKVYETHIREVHAKVDLNEFSEPEDLMAGIDVDVDANVHNSDDDNKSWSKYRDEELHATEEDLLEIEAQEHVCHICKQPFPIRAILLQHLTTCRAANEQTAAEATENLQKKRGRKKQGELHCTECDRVFTHRNSLVYHMRSHTGDRPHQCEQCGKSFFAASALKVHMRLHSGDKPYKCADCGRQFRQWGDLKYHCISIHSDQKQYQCEYCGKDFARKYSLIVHRRIHTGEKNYKCEFCGKTFRASSYLQNHRRIHTGEKPHSCDICGKPFRVRSDMKRHLKTHGRARPVQCEVIVAKIEEEAETSEHLMMDSDENQTQETENEAVVDAALQYEQDPLDGIHDGNTLYTDGHQLYVLYPGDGPLRNTIEANSAWTQTTA